MDIVERRRFKRYPIYCPIEYRCEDGRPIDSSITLNMCEGGALLSTRRLLEPATRIIVKMTMKREAFFIRARVVHVGNYEDSGMRPVGVEFLQNPFNFVHRFYEELEAIMLYQRQYSEEAYRPVTLAEASMKWYGTSDPIL